MRRFVKGSIVTGVLALAVSSLGMAGTAHAETPAPARSQQSGVTVAETGPQVESARHFRIRFRSREDCERRARIDYDSRRIAWDCRRGPDPNGPWELWSE